jgi:hypothetical protein
MADFDNEFQFSAPSFHNFEGGEDDAVPDDGYFGELVALRRAFPNRYPNHVVLFRCTVQMLLVRVRFTCVVARRVELAAPSLPQKPQ